MPEFTPEEYSRRIEKVGEHEVGIISYKLGETYHAHAEIHLPGAGARLARAQGQSKAGAEEKALAGARRCLER